MTSSNPDLPRAGTRQTENSRQVIITALVAMVTIMMMMMIMMNIAMMMTMVMVFVCAKVKQEAAMLLSSPTPRSSSLYQVAGNE